MTKECRNCHHVMTKKEGSFQHLIFENKVTLHHVPYWECANCGHQFYDDPARVEQIVIEAMIKKQWDVEYD